MSFFSRIFGRGGEEDQPADENAPNAPQPDGTKAPAPPEPPRASSTTTPAQRPPEQAAGVKRSAERRAEPSEKRAQAPTAPGTPQANRRKGAASPVQAPVAPEPRAPRPAPDAPGTTPSPGRYAAVTPSSQRPQTTIGTGALPPPPPPRGSNAPAQTPTPTAGAPVSQNPASSRSPSQPPSRRQETISFENMAGRQVPGVDPRAAAQRKGAAPAEGAQAKAPSRRKDTLRMFVPDVDAALAAASVEGAAKAPEEGTTTMAGRPSLPSDALSDLFVAGPALAERSSPPTPSAPPTSSPSARSPAPAPANGATATAPRAPAAQFSADVASLEPLTFVEPLSERPGPPDAARKAAPRAVAATDAEDAAFEEMLSALERPVGSTAAPPALDTTHDMANARQLFGEIAANYARPIRDFMMEMDWGELPREWLDICVPAVASLRRSAETMEMPELCVALDGFMAALELSAASTEKNIATGARAELRSAYDVLVKVWPQAFAIEDDRSQREPIIVRSLLLQIEDLGKVALDKLYGAGLSTLDVFFLAKTEDITEAAGLTPELAARIVEKFRTYRREIETVVPHGARSSERDRLATLVQELRNQHEYYELAASSWTDDAISEKKRLRQARDATLLQVQVVLARVGEVERLRELEKLPFQRKIQELETYLDQAARAHP
jgi:hypothetical protein